MDDLEIRPGITIPGSELSESHSRSGGPGGQHVNTTSSRITLRWSIPDSALPEAIRQRLVQRLGSRLTTRGELIVHADGHRSQLRNREAARERLAAVVRDALVEQKKRRATRPTRGSQRRRVQAKKQRGERKRLRGRVQRDD